MWLSLIYYLFIQNVNSILSIITTSVILLFISHESLHFYANAISLMPIIFFADQGISRLILIKGHGKNLNFDLSLNNYKIFFISILFFITLNIYLNEFNIESLSITLAMIFNYSTSLIYSVLHVKRNNFFKLIIYKFLIIFTYALIFLKFIPLEISLILTLISLLTLYYVLNYGENYSKSLKIVPLKLFENILFIFIGLLPYAYLFLYKNEFPLLSICLGLGFILSGFLSPILINKNINIFIGSILYSIFSLILFFMYINIINYFKSKIGFYEFDFNLKQLIFYFFGFFLINVSFYLQTFNKKKLRF